VDPIGDTSEVLVDQLTFACTPRGRDEAPASYRASAFPS